MARIHGSHGSVKIDPTGGATAVVVASVNKWDADFSKDVVDVTCFGDTVKQSVMGLANCGGTLAGCYDSTTTPTQVFDVIFGATACTLHLVPSSLEPTFFFSGLAYLDGSIECDAKGAVTWAGKWVGAGPWALAP